MRVNGLVHLLRRKNVTYELTYAPLGALVGSCPPRIFNDEKELGATVCTRSGCRKPKSRSTVSGRPGRSRAPARPWWPRSEAQHPRVASGS